MRLGEPISGWDMCGCGEVRGPWFVVGPSSWHLAPHLVTLEELDLKTARVESVNMHGGQLDCWGAMTDLPYPDEFSFVVERMRRDLRKGELHHPFHHHCCFRIVQWVQVDAHRMPTTLLTLTLASW